MHAYELLEKTRRKGGIIKSGPEFVCPYWEPESRSCLLIEEGIYLPVCAHIATYCQTSQYALCGQYELLAAADRLRASNGLLASNRRRSVRIPTHHVFRFSEITDNDQLPSIREDDAWTVDFSAHGIRFATRQLLPPETALRFEVIKDSTDSLAGIGRVVWSKPIESSFLFHSGIAFTGHHPAVP
ncbi:PilZ domain-containing protein [Desulfobulbus sp.]|uniref:PilZ domain-containing protein n=1 Tax=Desulfobulbus sp. TaxID=895 RepID=UPI00286F7C08|nr:PilZ domain-containing protein [Desulfobulbus sp.]